MPRSQPGTKRPTKSRKSKGRAGKSKVGSPKGVFSARKSNPRKKK